MVSGYIYWLGLDLARIPQLLGRVICCLRFFSTTELFEIKAFIVPGQGIFGVNLDSLFTSLKGLIIFILITESYAFADPGRDKFRIDLMSTYNILLASQALYLSYPMKSCLKIVFYSSFSFSL